MEQLLSLIRLLPATLPTAGSLLPALSDAAPKVGGGGLHGLVGSGGMCSGEEEVWTRPRGCVIPCHPRVLHASPWYAQHPTPGIAVPCPVMFPQGAPLGDQSLHVMGTFQK